jgi:glycosyltransferase involved in cell wall biosynthesis
MGLIENLPADRFELWLCSTRSYEPAATERLRARGVHHVHLGRRTKTDLWRLGGLARTLTRRRFDVLHAHMFGSNLWGTMIGTACRVPVIIAHEQTWSYTGEPLRRLLDGRVIGRLATRFVAVSSRDAERMVSIEHVAPDKITMIPNAYVPHPAPPGEPLRATLGLSETTPLLGTVAMLRPQKALSVLLDAFAIVLQTVGDVHLAIAGDGECRDELQAQTERMALTDRVHFLGRRSDVDSILGALDVAVMSSDFEGTPLVAYECIVNGTPLVATDVGGLRDIVQDGVTGLLVPPRDPARLAAALTELLVDPARRLQIVRTASARAPEITIAATARRFSELYESLVAEHRGG